MDNINIDGNIYKIKIIYKPTNKYMYMRVKNDNIVITTPSKLTENKLLNFINKNKEFILKRTKLNNVNDNKIHYLGKEYNLIINNSINNNVYIEDDNFIVNTTDISIKHINTLMEVFYNNTLKKIVEIYAEEIKNKFNMKYNVSYKYKYQKSVFGKCYINKKIILLSSKLAKYDLKYILLTIYHEYAHFKVPNHQKEYYLYIESVYPNYKKEHKEFKKIKYNEIYLS